MKLKPCPFCGGPGYDLDDVTAPRDIIEGDPTIACLGPDCPQVSVRLSLWNNRPGEDVIHTAAQEDERKKWRKIVESFSRGDCFCPVAIGNPNYKGIHTKACNNAREALEADKIDVLGGLGLSKR